MPHITSSTEDTENTCILIKQNQEYSTIYPILILNLKGNAVSVVIDTMSGKVTLLKLLKHTHILQTDVEMTQSISRHENKLFAAKFYA